jgi:hypothetical protein
MLEYLEPFMLTNQNLNKYYTLLDNKNLLNKVEKINLFSKDKKKSSNINKNENKFSIDNEDKLFWAFYIFLHGYKEYYLISNHFITEKNFKINCIEEIRKNKDLLKSNKISKNIVENELVNEKQISLNALNCLALLYKLNIIYIKKRLIYIINYSDEKICNCKNIIEDKDNKINIINLTSDVIDELINTYYIIDNLNKPINAISYYKLDDLIKISKKLNLEIINKNKNNIYLEIKNYINN